MRKTLNNFYYTAACLTPAGACALLLSIDRSLCAYARNQDLCLRDHAFSESWWKVIAAAGLGVLFSHAIRWSSNRLRGPTQPVL